MPELLLTALHNGVLGRMKLAKTVARFEYPTRQHTPVKEADFRGVCPAVSREEKTEQPSRGEVLLIGRDDMLLKTRCAILVRDGYLCHASRSLKEEDLSSQRFMVVIICHTVAEIEACRIFREFSEKASLTPVLRLARNPFREDAAFDGVLSTTYPSAFMEEVKRLSILGVLRRIRKLAELRAAELL